MLCKNCGEKVPDGLSTCPHCGTPVEEELQAVADTVTEDAADAVAPESEDDIKTVADLAAEDSSPTVALPAVTPEEEKTEAAFPTEASVFQSQNDKPLQQEDPMAQDMGAAVLPKKTGGKGGKTAAIIVAAVLVIAAIAVGVWLGLSKNKDKDDEKNNGTTVSQQADDSTEASDPTDPNGDTKEAPSDGDTTEAPTGEDDTTKPTDTDDTTKPADTDDTTKPADSKTTDKNDPTETTKKPKTTDPTKATDSKPDISEYRIARYKDMFASKKFLMEFTADDESISGPVTIATKDGNVYIAASMDMEGSSMSVGIIYQADTNKTYMLMPQMKIYSEMTEEMMGDSSIADMFDIDGLTENFSAEMNDATIKTSTKKVDGKSLYCESITGKDGLTTNYYFDGDDLVLIENIDGHDSSSTMKITKLTDNVPDSLFEIPKGYVYMDLNALGGLFG